MRRVTLSMRTLSPSPHPMFLQCEHLTVERNSLVNAAMASRDRPSRAFCKDERDKTTNADETMHVKMIVTHV